MKLLYLEIKQMISFRERLIGLMFKKEIKDGAIIFENCRSIHTCFMYQSIDIIALNREFVITDIRRGVKPWHFIFFKSPSQHVIEMKSVPSRVRIGDKIIFEKRDRHGIVDELDI